MWCPGGSDDECEDGELCWADTTCNFLDITPQPTLRPTISSTSVPATESPVSHDDPINTSFCGSSLLSALEGCSLETHCPSGDHADCLDGGYCWSVIGCNVIDLLAASDATPPPSAVGPTWSPSTQSPLLLPLEEAPENSEPTADPTEYSSASTSTHIVEPSFGPSTSTPSVDTLAPAAIVIDPPTGGPSVYTLVDDAIAYFPPSDTALPAPSRTSAGLIQSLVQSVKSSLEDEVFVVELRSGAVHPSTLYTYEGFSKSLALFTDVGVLGRYLYLGTGQNTAEIEYGIANLALFLARMMDTISHERCDPDFISCGMPPLGRSFREQHLRVECSPLSSETVMECPNESGCVCILGMLNHLIGVQSGSSEGNNSHLVYSGVDFCETDLLQSICSRRLEYSEELRWIVAMAHWVYFVQPYDNDDWNYAERLHDFVNGGMMDRDFVDRVGELSVLGDQATMDSSIEDPSNEKFFHFFFKAMRKLSEGMTQALHLETAAARPTDSPSLIFPPKTHAPSLLPGTHAPTNSPTATSSTASDPILPIDGHVTPADPLETSMDDYENDPNSSVAGYRPMIESVNAVTVSGLSDKDNSISPPNTSTETIQPKVSSSSATPFGLPWP